MDNAIQNLRKGPLGPAINWIDAHPRLSVWFVLATGMVILLAIEARGIGLLIGQWIALIIATILVAGACIWIISWEDEEMLDEEADLEADEEVEASDE